MKYATPEEADRAIRALNDNFTFQGVCLYFFSFCHGSFLSFSINTLLRE